MGHFVPVLPPGTKASSLLSRKANPGSKTRTNGPMEPGQKAVFVVVSVWRNGQDFDGINGVISKLVNNCGRKRIEIVPEAIKNVPLRERTTVRDLAHALGVKKSTLHNHFREGYFRRHTNDLKFALTDENKKARVR